MGNSLQPVRLRHIQPGDIFVIKSRKPGLILRLQRVLCERAVFRAILQLGRIRKQYSV